MKKERGGKRRKIINSTARAIAGLRLTPYITTVGSLMFARNVSEPPFPKNHLFSCTKTNEVSFAVSLQCFPLEEASSGAGGQLTSHGKGSRGTRGYILCESRAAVGRVPRRVVPLDATWGWCGRNGRRRVVEPRATACHPRSCSQPWLFSLRPRKARMAEKQTKTALKLAILGVVNAQVKILESRFSNKFGCH